MATLTSSQLVDLQADLGITDDESVFTDVELNRLYTRADSDYATTVAYSFRQLWANAAKFANYTQNQSSEQKRQIFENLGELMRHAEAHAGIAGGVLSIGSIDLNFLEDDPDA
jgi:DNA replication protein DnaD